MLNAFVDYGNCRVSECLAKVFVNANWLLQVQDLNSKNKQLLLACVPSMKFFLQHLQTLFSIVLQTVEVEIISVYKFATCSLIFHAFFLQATTPLFSLESMNRMGLKIQAIYKMQQSSFTYMMLLQAKCAVTSDAKLRASLKKVIDNVMPLEMAAHTWRSVFYYRYFITKLVYF